MINDIRFLLGREQPLDVWVYEILAPINDIVYDLFTRLDQIMNEVFKDVR